MAELDSQRSGVGISEIKVQVTSQSWEGLTVALMAIGTTHRKERLALQILGLLFNFHYISLPTIPM